MPQVVRKMTNLAPPEHEIVELGDKIELFKMHGSLNWVDEKHAFKIPKTIDDAKILGNVLYKYSKHHRYIIMIAFFMTYIL